MFVQIRKQAYSKHFPPHEHFSVGGTLIDASASVKSFVLKSESLKKAENNDKNNKLDDGGSKKAEADFKRDERRSNKTHESKADPVTRLYKKSKSSAARLCTMGHIITEYPHGIIVHATLTEANTSQGWDAGLEMIDKLNIRPDRMIQADKSYDTKRFVEGCREKKSLHTWQRKSVVELFDGRTTCKPGIDAIYGKTTTDWLIYVRR